MGVPQYTTPTVTLNFSDRIDLSAARSVYVTFSARGVTLTKTGEDLTVGAHSIGVRLSQDDTRSLGVGTVKIQANWLDGIGTRIASDIATAEITEQLLKKVLP